MNELDLLRHVVWWSEPESDIEIFAGRLPEPSSELPRIDGSVVGSIVRRVRGEVVTVEVHYRVVGDPISVLDRLEGSLAAEGLRAISPRRPGNGFQKLPPQWDWTRYYASEKGPYYSAFVRPIDAATTALWLKWEGQGGWHPREFEEASGPVAHFGELPRINLPQGVLVPEHGGGGRIGALSSDALVVSDMTPRALHDHAALQLEAAGWQRTGAPPDEHAWSTWSLPDTEWSAVLAVAALPVANERALLLRSWSRKELEGAAQRMSGWRPQATA